MCARKRCLRVCELPVCYQLYNQPETDVDPSLCHFTMPKSKRAKMGALSRLLGLHRRQKLPTTSLDDIIVLGVRAVTLSKTTAKPALKEDLVNSIRECVDMFSNAFVFTFENMRTVAFKDVRAAWKDSRFFLGKNKVMRVALGRDHEDEYRDGLADLGRGLVGSVGLLFTNRSKEEVMEYFSKLAVRDFARMGAPATDTVMMQAGALTGMAHTMVEQLRKLGMPVELQNGVVHLTSDYTVCKEGEALSVDQARILVRAGAGLWPAFVA